jgi:hypothetical protein
MTTSSEIKKINTFFVVRDTDHAQEDLERNWSSFSGGSCNGELGGSTEENARASYAFEIGVESDEVDCDFRFHPAYGQFVVVHYEGLGGYALEAQTTEEALKEADKYMDSLAVTMGAGDGHFCAEDVVSFQKVREGRYIFEIKL